LAYKNKNNYNTLDNCVYFIRENLQDLGRKTQVSFVNEALGILDEVI
jgi:hypothetical protein